MPDAKRLKKYLRPRKKTHPTSRSMEQEIIGLNEIIRLDDISKDFYRETIQDFIDTLQVCSTEKVGDFRLVNDTELQQVIQRGLTALGKLPTDEEKVAELEQQKCEEHPNS